jgi:hypothetical protein
MNVEGAVKVTLSGPADKQQSALEAIQAAGVVAEKSVYELGKIEAWFTDGTENPPRSFLDECEARAAAASEGTGFTVEGSGIWGTGAFGATSKWIIDTETGDFHGAVDTAWHSPQEREERRQRVADSLGIPISRLEFQDPPTFRPPTS